MTGALGGGTALMLQIGHRESHDIDLFISDAQYLPFLNPETQGYRLEIAASDYETDGTRALKIVFDGVGEIDFICCGPVTEDPFTLSEIRGRRVRLETPAEILAKKVVFGALNFSRATCSTSRPRPRRLAPTMSPQHCQRSRRLLEKLWPWSRGWIHGCSNPSRAICS